MERYRIVYYNRRKEASEAIIDAASGEAALKSLGEEVWKFCTLTSLGPAPDVEPASEEPFDPQGSYSYPWSSREERLEDQAGSGPDA